MTDGIQNYLDDQSEDGQSLDGGEFTLHSAKARAKLAQFAFPEPGLWVVKIVQAAVAAGAPWIDFKFLKREVQIRFLNTQNWDAEMILKLILSATTSSSRDLMHLQAGLLAVSSGINEMVAWSCGGKQVRVGEDQCEVSEALANEEVQIQAKRPAKSFTEQGLFNSPVRYLFRQTAHEYKALVERCFCCPIPVILDSYELPRRYAQPSGMLPRKDGFDSESNTGMRQVFAIQPITYQESPTELAYPLSEEQTYPEVEPLENKAHFTATQFPARGPVNGIVVLHSALQYKSRVNLLVDGAVIEKEPLDTVLKDSRLEQALADVKEDFYLDVYLSVDASQLDLSHFQLKSQNLEALVPILARATHQVLDSMQRHCDRPWKFDTFDLRLLKGNIKNVSAGEVLGAGFLSMFIPHAVVIGGIALVASPLVSLAKPHLDRRKAKALKKRISSVLTKLEALT